ncbi:alpha-L-fucosidase [Joostella sp.]|uniref:alpha-L-fucosidase n=1 Tax=Joostella sp. TaxID=2231138 RepID=UPI003A926DE4
MKVLRKVLFLSFTLMYSLSFSQEKEKSMDKMWGDNQTNKTTVVSPLFKDGNYAMFIHWGLYSKLGGVWNDKTYYGISEWLMNPRVADIAPEDYMKEAKTFNPVDFNAEAIVQLAKDAGMKYIIVTSKHHDGFAMYDSKANDFNIVDATPFGRDPMKELAEACKKEGIGFGFYYSHNQDWTYPGGNGGPETTPEGKEVGFDYYFKTKCLPQVEEITTEYGDIALVWFDTPGDMKKEYADQLVDVVRKNQPKAMVSGRVGHGLGDYLSLGDMNIPKENIDGLWETVDVTNDSWGYAWYDNNWKSPKKILENIISTVARGGTYMLNIGPDPTGNVKEQAVLSLRKSGDWLKKYPQVIYNAEASPWNHELPWGDVTIAKDGSVNLLVYNWPSNGKLALPGLKSKIKDATLLFDDKRESISFSKNNDWTIFNLPSTAPSKLVSVISLNLDGEIEVNKTIGIDPTTETDISVAFAEAENATIDDIRWMEKFGEWKHITHATDWKVNDSKLTFEVEVLEPGFYQTELNYKGTGRVVWNIANSERYIVQNEQSASSVYTTYPFGWLKFDKPGKHTITIKFAEGDSEKISLKKLIITPIDF